MIDTACCRCGCAIQFELDELLERRGMPCPNCKRESGITIQEWSDFPSFHPWIVPYWAFIHWN